MLLLPFPALFYELPLFAAVKSGHVLGQVPPVLYGIQIGSRLNVDVTGSLHVPMLTVFVAATS
jgi:hypothetical protein